MTNDVEKRWHDPQAFHSAVTYVVAVIAVAGVCFAFYAIPDDHSLIAAILVIGFVYWIVTRAEERQK